MIVKIYPVVFQFSKQILNRLLVAWYTFFIDNHLQLFPNQENLP